MSTAFPRREIPGLLIFGLSLISTGTALLVLHRTPISDYYFPIIWFGYIMTVDGALQRHGVQSLSREPMLFAILFALSAGFWWLFEWFNLAVNNWRYIGGAEFVGIWHVLFASLCFSTVLPAVWETVCLVTALFPELAEGRRPPLHDLHFRSFQRPSTRMAALACAEMLCGVACIVLPVLFPMYAFGLIWGALLFLCDPINLLRGGPSLLRQALERSFDRLAVMGAAGLICGFFWEAWNYRATVKWVYSVPIIPQQKIFEMPVLGYAGYIPFGWEVYATSVLLAPFAGMCVTTARRVLNHR
jgi:hypothetical protein